MAPIADAFAQGWPDADVVNILDDGLSRDRRRQPTLSADLRRRIIDLAQYAHNCGADAILFACSAFGSAIDEAAAQLPVPVLRPNDAMFQAALSHGNSPVLLVTFEPAGPAMVEEFEELVAKKNSVARLSCINVADALTALENGDSSQHDALIAKAASNASDASAVLLGQFSMATAAKACVAATDTPVFTSPDAAVAQLRTVLAKR